MPHPTLNNPLARLTLEALKRTGGYSLPESTLKETLAPMVRPTATDEDFRDTFLLLLQRELIAFSTDRLTDEKKYTLTELGENYLRPN